MLAASLVASLSAPRADLVTSLPGFSSWPFKAYSGYIDVPGPFEQNDYDSLSIHYQFHESQNSPTSDPLVIWHQGGPGASSINLGLYTEMGYFQVGDEGPYVNEFAWNRVANMLYLESPAGSGSSGLGGHGSSECRKGGQAVACNWNDGSQAEAYAHTLTAFHKAFPEFKSNDFFLTGESYFGAYGPNIANYILTHAPFNETLNLKGIAQGNAVISGVHTDMHGVDVDVANLEDANVGRGGQDDLDMYWGKGLVSRKLYNAAYKACGYPGPGETRGLAVDHPMPDEASCNDLVQEAFSKVGPHNTYFIYDNCDLSTLQDFLTATNKSWHWLTKARRIELATNGQHTPLTEAWAAYVSRHNAHDGRALAGVNGNLTGGFPWACGGEDAIRNYLYRPDVMSALHLREKGRSAFHYTHGGGTPTFELWPFLASKLRVLIYSGDADACVPYKGSEDWVAQLESNGVLEETGAWRPWYGTSGKGRYAPAGYATTYKEKSTGNAFGYVTVRLAGHMVPTFMPSYGFDLFDRFLKGEPY